jgi:glutamate synthase domain-containing protein 1
MCGIVGYINTRGDAEAPVGRVLFDMLSALGRRGPDSAGVAFYSDRNDDGLVFQVKLGEDGPFDAIGERLIGIVRGVTDLQSAGVVGRYLRFVVHESVDPYLLRRTVEEADPDVEVVSIGRRLEIVKQVGSPSELEASYNISSVRGTHGIGHTRLSTESRVDLSHSQPFWARGDLDLAVVHNGHITNYHKLRRQYEMRGVKLYTENDSEIIGIYLAGRMARGLSFEEALTTSIRDLDGSFSYIAATADQLGFVKDPFGLKPLIVAETDAYVAIATEEIALRSALGVDFEAWEPGVRAIKVWSLPGRVASAA